MKRVWTLLLAALMLFAAGCSTTSSKKNSTAQRAAVTSEMYKADFWLGKVKEPDKKLLTASDIAKVNAQITNDTGSGVVDLVSYPSALSAVQLKRYLNAVPMPSVDLYDAEGARYEEAFFEELITSVDTESIEETNKVSYAVALHNTSLRSYPVLAAAYEDPKAPDVDVFQLGQVLVGDPLLVLHANAESTWFFVQTRTQRGWVRSDLVCFMEKGSWVSYIETTHFLVVTGPSVTLENNPYAEELSGLTLYMGTRLLLYTNDSEFDELYRRGTDGCYIAKYPTMDRFGYLEYQPVLIPMSEDVSEGYLPYTTGNLLRQAMKMTGRRLAVNRVGGGRDSAAFVQDLYSVFGIFMPADVKAQKAIIANDPDFAEITSAARKTNLEKLDPGTLLYSDDRAFLYLGQEGKNPYVITALDEYYYDDVRYTANAMAITSLDIVKKDGTVFLDTLEVAKGLGEVKEEKPESDGKGSSTTAATTAATKATTTTAKKDSGLSTTPSTTKADS